MECISIVAPIDGNYIKRMIGDQKELNNTSNIKVLDDEINKTINVKVYENEWDTIKDNFVNIIYKCIIDNYEKKIIKDIINSEYTFLSIPEKEEIFNIAVSLIYTKEYKSIFKERTKSVIIKQLNDYLNTSKKIIIEGFVNFRLKEYRNELNDIVEKAVDEYLMEKEYKEFLMLLNYFVEIQEPKIDSINIIKKSEKYYLVNSYGSIIENDFVDDIAGEITKDVDEEDLLISSLITFAPKKIIIHKSCDVDVKLNKMLNNIFPGKIEFCSGCEMCTQIKLN